MNKIVLLYLLLAAYQSSIAQHFGFIQNKGQIMDQNGVYNDDVLFLAPVSNNMNIQIRQNGFSYDTYKMIEDDKVTFQRIDVEFLGANTRAEILAEEEFRDYINYYTTGLRGNEAFKTPKFRKIIYKEIYPGIDLIFSINSNGDQPVKFDFKISSEANIDDIKLHYSGYSGFENTGELKFQLSEGTLTESIPASWYENSRKEIDVQYKVLDEENDAIIIGFGIVDPDEKDPDATLILDPEPALSWGTYYGDTLTDKGMDVMTDNWGYIYMAGNTQSFNNLATSGVHQDTMTGGFSDVFIVKFHEDGSRIWSTYFGGTGTDEVNSIMVDTTFRVMITGWTDSPNGIASDSCYQDTLNSGTKDAFVAKFNIDGTRYWSTYFGGEGEDIGTGVDTDFDGNVFVSGITSGSSTGIASAGAFQSVNSGQIDGFILKLDSMGFPYWSTFYGGVNDDLTDGISSEGNHILLTGSTDSDAGISTPGSHQEIYGGSVDALVADFDQNGNLQWATYFGGDSLDAGLDVEIFNSQVYLAGKTSSDSVIATTGAFKTQRDSVDAFLVRFDTLGNRIWATYFGGESYDEALATGVELDSNIYIFGNTYSANNVAFGDVHDTTYNGNCDAYLAKFDNDGTFIVSSYYGGPNDDFATGGDVYKRTSIYMSGFTNSLDSIAYANSGSNVYSYQDSLAGGNADAFLVRFVTKQSAAPVCIGGCASGSGSGGVDYCEGDLMTLTVNGGSLGQGANWVWYIDDCGQNGTQVGIGDTLFYIAPSANITFYVRAESINNTTDCVEITALIGPKPNAGITANDTSLCAGMALELLGSGGGYYQWSGPNALVSTMSDVVIDSILFDHAGNYNLIVNSDFGCKDTVDISISVLTSPSVSFDIVDASCFQGNDGSVVAHTNGLDSLIYTWQPSLSADSVMTNLSPGVYILTVSDTNQCSITDTAVVSSPPSFILGMSSSPAHCNQPDGSTVVNVAGNLSDYSFSWNPGNDSTALAENLIPGLMTVTVSVDSGCTETDTIMVENIPGPVIDSINVSHESCSEENDGSIDVFISQGTPNYQFNWSPTGDTLSYLDELEPGIYTVDVTDQFGCSVTDSIEILLTEPIKVSIDSFHHEHCGLSNGAIWASAQGGTGILTYYWSPLGLTNQDIFNQPAGDYELIVTDENGCQQSAVATLDSLSGPTASILSSETQITGGESLTLEADVQPAGTYTYQWTPESTVDCPVCGIVTATPVDTTVYLLEVTDEFGCKDSVEVLIIVLPCGSFYIPDIFSPNKDGLNDDWMVLGNCLSGVQVSVYNRWGEQIFFSDEFNNTWDGTYKGKQVDAGNYVYQAEIIFEDGTAVSQSGNIKVTR